MKLWFSGFEKHDTQVEKKIWFCTQIVDQFGVISNWMGFIALGVIWEQK